MKKYLILMAFFIATLTLAQFSAAFAFVTFALSLWVLGRIEADKNTHELSFYVQGELTESFKKWFRRYAIAEVFIRSTVIGILSLFLFSGTDTGRILSIALIFSCCVLFGYFTMAYIQRISKIDVTRWGYIRLSVMIGLAFSIICSIVPGLRIRQISWEIGKNAAGKSFSFDELAELLYGLNYQVNDFITKVLCSIFNDIIGTALSLLISTNVLFGLVIVMYSLLLLQTIQRFRLASTLTEQQ